MAKGKILCVDPGPTTSGYAIIDLSSWTVEAKGTVDWDTLIDIAENVGNNGGVGVAVEKTIMYTIPGKKGGFSPNNNHVVTTAFNSGRLYQIAHDMEMEYREDTRARIIKKLTGWNTQGKGNKVTKGDMQHYVKGILKLDKPIQPQHANDAVCAGLALFDHPVTKKVNQNGSRKGTKKKTGKRKSSKAQ